MKIFFTLIFLLPVFSYAQTLTNDGLNRVRITDQERIVQAEILPVKSEPKKKIDRFYYWYSSNSIHITQGSYSGNLLNGNYNEYFTDRSLKAQGQFKSGLKDGIWREWNTNGILIELYTWKKGVKNGRYQLFDEQGSLKETGIYKNNVLIDPKSVKFWKHFNFFKKKKN